MVWNKIKDLQRLLLAEQATLLELEEVLPEVRADLPAHDVPEQPLTPRDILVAPELTPEIYDPIDPSEVEPLRTEPPSVLPRNGHRLGDLYSLWSRGRSVTESTKERDRLRFASLTKFRINAETPLDALTTQRLRELQAEMVPKYNPNTVRDTFMKLLRPMLELAVENGWLQTNPAAKVKLVKHLEPDRKEHTWENAKRIIVEAEQARYQNGRSGEILRAMLLLGLGQGEVKPLRGPDFDLERGEIHIRRQKTKKPFTVPIYPHAKAFIEQLHTTGRLKPDRLVFQWQDPEQAFYGATRRLGLPRFECRSLRRTLIGHLLELGCDVRDVAKWQGHSDNGVTILRVYARYIDKARQRKTLETLPTD